jgi:hypothetical protein
MRCTDLATALLRAPERTHNHSAEEWTLLIRQARSAEVMGQIYAQLQQHDLLQVVPKRVLPHIENSWRLSQRQQEALRGELQYIAKALAPLEIPIVLLKGAAYSAAGLAASRGRLFSDVDILVPKAALATVEKALFRHGWMPTHMNAYDQRYYREWMHELPPVEHIRRGTLIDIHHTLLPPTTGVRCDAAALIAAARPLADAELGAFKVLAPSDMLLHSATHLFYGEFDRGLRELVDLDRLIRELASEPDFWSTTLDRARQLDLLNPLHHAVRYTHLLLGTPIPDEVLQAPLDPAVSGIRQRLLDALFLRAFRPDHASCNDALTRLARWLAFVRSHWLRMPVYLLVPHLLYKSLISLRKEEGG